MMLVAVNSPSPYTPKNMSATHALLQEGRYRINSEFSHEGSGSVYDAYDTVSETNVIVKEISAKINTVATSAQLPRERLWREIRRVRESHRRKDAAREAMR